MNKNRAITGIRLESRSTTDRQSKHTLGAYRTAFTLCVLVLVATLTACSASTSNASPTSASPATIVPQATATSAPTAIAAATAIPTETSAVQQAVAPTQQAVLSTQLDPCQLISSQEASTLTGATYGQGVEASTPGGLKICHYGSNSTNVFTIEVTQAPDVATAQSDKAQFLAEIQSNMQQLTSEGLNVTQLPNFADGAVKADANVSANGMSLSGAAFGFLKGTIFFGFSDLAIGGTAPTDAAMQAEANTVLAKLP